MGDRHGYLHYDAWGNTTHTVGSTEQPYQYVGQLGYYTHYQDENLALLQLGVRFYDPQTGRFTQLDPLHEGANWFAYVANRASVATDPNGLSAYSTLPIDTGIYGPPGRSPNDQTIGPAPAPHIGAPPRRDLPGCCILPKPDYAGCMITCMTGAVGAFLTPCLLCRLAGGFAAHCAIGCAIIMLGVEFFTCHKLCTADPCMEIPEMSGLPRDQFPDFTPRLPPPIKLPRYMQPFGVR